LPDQERQRGKEQLIAVVDEFSPQMTIRSYSLVGLRADADFLLWQISPDIDAFQELATRLLATDLGKYLTTPHSFLAMTRRSPYIEGHRHEGQEGAGRGIYPANAKYLFVYPFVKTHDWYQLPQEERQQMMNQHFEIGHKHPSVRIHTSYSFGIDDQDHMLAFETDDPVDFLESVMELREAAARPYTVRDTPIFACIKRSLREALDSLGG
jgi:chlorite dismutase